MYEITLKHKNNHRPYTAKELQMETLKWKLKFHQDCIKEVEKQIKMLEEQDD